MKEKEQQEVEAFIDAAFDYLEAQETPWESLIQEEPDGTPVALADRVMPGPWHLIDKR